MSMSRSGSATPNENGRDDLSQLTPYTLAQFTTRNKGERQPIEITQTTLESIRLLPTDWSHIHNGIDCINETLSEEGNNKKIQLIRLASIIDAINQIAPTNHVIFKATRSRQKRLFFWGSHKNLITISILTCLPETVDCPLKEVAVINKSLDILSSPDTIGGGTSISKKPSQGSIRREGVTSATAKVSEGSLGRKEGMITHQEWLKKFGMNSGPNQRYSQLSQLSEKRSIYYESLNQNTNSTASGFGVYDTISPVAPNGTRPVSILYYDTLQSASNPNSLTNERIYDILELAGDTHSDSDSMGLDKSNDHIYDTLGIPLSEPDASPLPKVNSDEHDLYLALPPFATTYHHVEYDVMKSPKESPLADKN